MSEYDPPKTDPKPESDSTAEPNDDSINPKDIRAAFNTESLLMAIAVLALGGGICFVQPGIGIIVLVLAVPALIRAFSLGALRRSKGETPSTGQKILLFVTSTLLTALVGIAALIAFVAICFPMGLAGFGLQGGLHGEPYGNGTLGVVVFFGGWIIGAIAGIGVLVLGYRLLFWRRW